MNSNYRMLYFDINSRYSDESTRENTDNLIFNKSVYDDSSAFYLVNSDGGFYINKYDKYMSEAFKSSKIKMDFYIVGIGEISYYDDILLNLKMKKNGEIVKSDFDIFTLIDKEMMIYSCELFNNFINRFNKKIYTKANLFIDFNNYVSNIDDSNELYKYYKENFKYNLLYHKDKLFFNHSEDDSKNNVPICVTKIFNNIDFSEIKNVTISDSNIYYDDNIDVKEIIGKEYNSNDIIDDDFFNYNFSDIEDKKDEQYYFYNDFSNLNTYVKNLKNENNNNNNIQNQWYKKIKLNKITLINSKCFNINAKEIVFDNYKRYKNCYLELEDIEEVAKFNIECDKQVLMLNDHVETIHLQKNIYNNFIHAKSIKNLYIDNVTQLINLKNVEIENLYINSFVSNDYSYLKENNIFENNKIINLIIKNKIVFEDIIINQFLKNINVIYDEENIFNDSIEIHYLNKKVSILNDIEKIKEYLINTGVKSFSIDDEMNILINDENIVLNNIEVKDFKIKANNIIIQNCIINNLDVVANKVLLADNKLKNININSKYIKFFNNTIYKAYIKNIEYSLIKYNIVKEILLDNCKKCFIIKNRIDLLDIIESNILIKYSIIYYVKNNNSIIEEKSYNEIKVFHTNTNFLNTKSIKTQHYTNSCSKYINIDTILKISDESDKELYVKWLNSIEVGFYINSNLMNIKYFEKIAFDNLKYLLSIIKTLNRNGIFKIVCLIKYLEINYINLLNKLYKKNLGELYNLLEAIIKKDKDDIVDFIINYKTKKEKSKIIRDILKYRREKYKKTKENIIINTYFNVDTFLNKILYGNIK